MVERPAWVRRALVGEGGPVYEPARRRFDADELSAEASMLVGLDDFGPDTHREGLELLCRLLDEEAGLHLLGRWRARNLVLRLLENRLLLESYAAGDGGVRDEAIVAPLIVVGSPRAGTTILHQLLALAPGARAPLAWELWRPTPPPTADGAATDPRIPLADVDVRLTAELSPGFDGLHHQGALLPRECMHAMAVDFRADIFSGHYPMPTYERWLFDADLTSAYAWHELVLQVLQRRQPTERWVLKAPGHLAHLPTLLARYPDATIVVCHRDPLAMISSVTSLLATIQSSHADQVDRAALARRQIDGFLGQFDRLMAWLDEGVIDPTRLHHQRFDEFLDDPVAAVAAIHDHAGTPMTPEHETAVRAHLDANPQGGRGGHRHDLSDLGLDAAAERERFAPYVSRFGLEER